MKRLIYILTIFLMGIWFTSCRTKYVPVEVIKKETEYRDKWQRDSIHIKDSIFLYMKGNTMFRDRWHTEYKDRLIRDTAFIHKVDSIPYPVEIEKKLSKWQSLKMELGGWAFGIIIVIALVIVGWLVFRKRNK